MKNKFVSIMFVNVSKRDINLMAILVSVSCHHINIAGNKPLSEGALPNTVRIRFKKDFGSPKRLS